MTDTCVLDIEDLGENIFTESDSKPAYLVYSGFFTEKDVIEEKQNLAIKCLYLKG